MQSATCLSAITIARYDVIITILTILVLFSLALGWVSACFLVRHQVIDRMDFLKKRALPIAALTLISFALGWVCVCFRVQFSADERIARVEAEQGRLITTLRQRIYGTNFFHNKGLSSEDDARMEGFDPAASKGFITLSYVGGMGHSNTQLKIECNGAVSVTEHGVTRKAATMNQGRCSDFFKRVLTSGVLNYSHDVITLKKALTYPLWYAAAGLEPDTDFEISIPELGIEKTILLDAPAQSEIKSNPDIIEFQLIAKIENEILGFIPKDDPFWSPNTR